MFHVSLFSCTAVSESELRLPVCVSLPTTIPFPTHLPGLQPEPMWGHAPPTHHDGSHPIRLGGGGSALHSRPLAPYATLVHWHGWVSWLCGGQLPVPRAGAT